MISLKKYMDSVDDGADCAGDSPPETLSLVIDAYRSTLLEMGNCGVDACPALGPELRRGLSRFEEALSKHGNTRSISSMEDGVRKLLQDWGRHTSHYYQEKAAEVRDLLLIMAHTADSVVRRDQRCALQIEAVTKDLENIATLEDLSEIRAAIEKRAMELRNSIDRMATEGKAVVDHLRIEVATYQAKLDHADYIASCDSMTGLGSRLWVENCIQRRIDSHIDFCVVIIDIDRFKRVNEDHGHLTGDLVLKQFATELRSVCRATDIVGRWSGDDFILLLDCELQEARAHVDRLRSWLCGSYSIPGKQGPLNLPLEAAIGVAQHRQNETLTDLINRADLEMYLHKSTSRSRMTA
jgi:diguanylate cyclase (GGDEF)-like protein